MVICIYGISNSDYRDKASGGLVLGIVFYQLLINTIDFDKQANTSDKLKWSYNILLWYNFQDSVRNLFFCKTLIDYDSLGIENLVKWPFFFQNLMVHKRILPRGMSCVMMSQQIYFLRKHKLLKKCGFSRNPHLPTLK